jgi:thymidylate synthase
VRQYDFVSKRYGLYFDRLISYGHSKQKVNQLEYIIKTRTEHNNRRRSALQASVINPHLDHDNMPVRGFPCLQQVSFAPLNGGGLSITGYYPQQYIIDRAYGNYLGLCRLGHFMANELGLKFVEMNCIAGIARLGKINKTDDELKDLNDLIKMRIKQYEKE